MHIINQICYFVVICCVAIAGLLLIDREELTLAPLMISPAEHINFQRTDDALPESHAPVPTHRA